MTNALRSLLLASSALLPAAPASAATLGIAEGDPSRTVNMGALTDYLFVFADGSGDANWQSSSPGYTGDVFVSGKADHRTSGSFDYSGTISTDGAGIGAWQDIVDNNTTTASTAFDRTATLSQLNADFATAVGDIYGLSATPGFVTYDAGNDVNGFADASGLSFENDVAETVVINVTEGFGDMKEFRLSGDSDDLIVLRYDETAFDTSDGLNGEVKFNGSGPNTVLGGDAAFGAGNIIQIAGDLNSSGGSGGQFVGYWLTFGADGGAPSTATDSVLGYTNGPTGSFSNANFRGGWYTTTDSFSLTSGSRGTYVAPNPGITLPAIPLPAACWLLLTGFAALVLAGRRRLGTAA